MEIDVIYKYRAPRASFKDAATITTDTLELENPGDILNEPHPVGEIVELQSDEDKEQDKAPKEYRVVSRSPILTQRGAGPQGYHTPGWEKTGHRPNAA